MIKDVKFVISEYYEVLFSRFKYFEIVFTDEEVILVFIGDSLKNWMITGDPGALRREGFLKLPLNKMKHFSDEVVTIKKQDIFHITFNPGNFLKNPSLILETKDKTYKFYSKTKNNSEEISNFISSYSG